MRGMLTVAAVTVGIITAAAILGGLIALAVSGTDPPEQLRRIEYLRDPQQPDVCFRWVEGDLEAVRVPCTLAFPEP